FLCGACGARDEIDRQLSPTPRGPDVLPVRPWRHKAAVFLPCKKKTREHADACILFLPVYG
ncbi:hypothetical protein, partial [Aneurinibacillus aneurinilyticus]|uniref:hypothetical protein n=1 Tax=Aneurinibacillus aneurinilyticus TaxID=1391 RepID=UPI0023F29768